METENKNKVIYYKALPFYLIDNIMIMTNMENKIKTIIVEGYLDYLNPVQKFLGLKPTIQFNMYEIKEIFVDIDCHVDKYKKDFMRCKSENDIRNVIIKVYNFGFYTASNHFKNMINKKSKGLELEICSKQ